MRVSEVGKRDIGGVIRAEEQSQSVFMQHHSYVEKKKKKDRQTEIARGEERKGRPDNNN